MFGPSLPRCLIKVICVCLHIVVSNAYCVVFLFCFPSSLWIVPFWLLLLYYLTFIPSGQLEVCITSWQKLFWYKYRCQRITATASNIIHNIRKKPTQIWVIQFNTHNRPNWDIINVCPVHSEIHHIYLITTYQGNYCRQCQMLQKYTNQRNEVCHLYL
jgi:hypothetical protein